MDGPLGLIARWSYDHDLLLEPFCCKKQQKRSPIQETGLGNRERLKVLNDTKLVLNEHE